MNNTINPIMTLDKLGQVELGKVAELIHQYSYNGQADPKTGKILNSLPDTWDDNGVYVDYNPHSGFVFLANSDYETLIATETGLMGWYTTPYYDNEGTIFDLAKQFLENATDRDGKLLYIEAWFDWNKEDGAYLYGLITECLSALLPSNDVTGLLHVKDLIATAFIADRLPKLYQQHKSEIQAEVFINERLPELYKQYRDTKRTELSEETSPTVEAFISEQLPELYKQYSGGLQAESPEETNPLIAQDRA